MSELTKIIDDLKVAISWSGNIHGLLDLNLLLKRLEELDKKPQFNDNQKEMFTRLVNNYSWFGSLVDHALYEYLTDSERTLSNKEFAQVLEVFSLWVLEQEGTE
ncbi:hypothetical protein P7H24_13455 [Enterococcus thailandicus]|uniref:hypothetical protein n=1 Tax=Enterococcus thailandicus TaxID=417368 RepID=UPI00288CD7EF|nr:hypothetical protein [Enterococcus thailandicus]MDT2735464.1 hypothetical protein [Enterococcus thailandicus]